MNREQQLSAALSDAQNMIHGYVGRIAELESKLAAVQQGVQAEKITPDEWRKAVHEFWVKNSRKPLADDAEFLNAIADIAVRKYAATHPTTQGLDVQTVYEAECFRWLRDKAIEVWRKGPVVFMTDADGCPGDNNSWSKNILTGAALEKAIPVAAQAKQGEQA